MTCDCHVGIKGILLLFIITFTFFKHLFSRYCGKYLDSLWFNFVSTFLLIILWFYSHCIELNFLLSTDLHIWNDLPLELRHVDISLGQFRNMLKFL